MQIKKINNLKYFFLTTTLVVFFGFSNFIYAAESQFLFSLPANPVGVGDEFIVSLMLDSGDKVVNAVAGELIFSESLIHIERVTTGNSIVSSWIQPPTISGNSIVFSGIMPGGYDGIIDPLTNKSSNAVILTLVFKAQKAGMASIVFSDSHAFLHDGFGTEINITAVPASFSILSEGNHSVVTSSDTTIPEAFTPVVSSSPDLWNSANALFFSTTDKDSGIDHYEVREGNDDWMIGTSPYLLIDQSLSSRIQVKAVDGAGNYRIEEISGRNQFSMRMLVVPFTCILIVLYVFYFFVRRKVKKAKIHIQNNLKNIEDTE